MLTKIDKALEALKNNQTFQKVSGDEVLVVTKNAIVIRHFSYNETKQTVLAAKINNKIIGNSSGLRSLNQFRGSNAAATPEQLELSQKIPMIPFDVIKEAGLDLGKYKEIESGGEETIYRKLFRRSMTYAELEVLKKTCKVLEETKNKGYNNSVSFEVEYLKPEHFTGARLFEVSGRKFLLDIDRAELKHGIINPFLVELSNSYVGTIKDAYQSLKPSEVIEAESQGLKVLRQGEWFFIPLTNELELKRVEKRHQERVNEDLKTMSKSWSGRGVLRAGQNRPNNCDKFADLDGKFYVSGIVSHSGREHKDLKLNQFHRAVPNTSQTSWTITGDLD